MVNSGYYSSNNSKDKDERNDEAKKNEELFIQKNRDKIFNDLYLKELNTETLLNELDKQNDDDMEDYIMNKISNVEQGENCSYTNTVFINEILGLSGTKTFLEKLILIYKYNFECIRSFVDELFTSLVKNKENTPYIIRAICTIISKLIIIKYPNITNIQIISFISEFLFSNLIIPILFKPTFNGIMMYDFDKRKGATNRYTKIVAITKIIKKLLRGEFYDSSKGNESSFTIFNSYFIEIMPHLLDFFRNISAAKLPINIETLLEYKKQGKNGNRDIEYNFLKVHPEERLEHQSICLT